MTKNQHKKTSKYNTPEEQPQQVEGDAVQRFIKKQRKKYSVSDYVAGILNRDITILSQSVTLVESAHPEHQKISRQIIESCLPYSGNSIRVGITGVHGVGKSTFIEALGMYLAGKGKHLSVLTIDPSSEISKGSILGDKTRMENLSAEHNVYIRPSPASGSLGGVTRKTRETIILCEAAGFDIIFVETVGVGQSEIAVHSMVDFFLLLMLAGAGDELQGIKRGIMEMADLIVINKADGDNKTKANHAITEYRNALKLYPPALSGWIPKVMTCSSKFSYGISDIWDEVLNYIALTKSNGYFNTKRMEQSKYWMYETINEALKEQFYNDREIMNKIKIYQQKVVEGKLSSFTAAQKLLEDYNKLNLV